MASSSETHARLKLADSLRWYHWLVLAGSLLLTFGAWYVTSQQATQIMRKRFDFQSDQIVQLVQERLQKYEEALWAGVALLHTMPPNTSRESWRVFAKNLRIEKRFPGINGIGVIHAHTRQSLPDYLAWQRQSLPEYQVHPAHNNKHYWPITYIEPYEGNAEAVGLDIAHEAKRYNSALKSRDTGLVQMTGPIVLVQDTKKTPGVLLYAPWYAGDNLPTSLGQRRDAFLGLVYAPFLMSELMHGTLANVNRLVNFSLHDGTTELYSELSDESVNYDAKPLFSRELRLDLHGRPWRFQVQSSAVFRAQNTPLQPLMILVGGLVINILLFSLFVVMARANRRAVRYAEEVHQDLQERQNELTNRNSRLKEANKELNQFAYIASHDLKEPLRTLSTFSDYLVKDVAAKNWVRVAEDVVHVDSASTRMSNLVTALLELSGAGNTKLHLKPVTSGELIAVITSNLGAQVESSHAELTFEDKGLVFSADKNLLVQVLQNLVSNAIKFHKHGQTPVVSISIRPAESSGFGLIEVSDEGIGICEDQLNNIFLAFKRLHSVREYEGTGIGLAIVKKVVDRHGGTIAVNSRIDLGSCFSLCLPLHAPLNVTDNQSMEQSKNEPKRRAVS